MQSRRIPTIPPPEKRLRLLIDTDAATEVDDQYALALALCAPERFDLRGIVAAHFGDDGGPAGIEESAAEIARVLAAAGQTGRFPILQGSHPLRYSSEPCHEETQKQRAELASNANNAAKNIGNFGSSAI